MTTLPQGALGLLDHEVARRLLASTELAHHRCYGPEQGAANVAAVDRPGVRMVRIAVRPSWAGVLDFQTRFPDAAPVQS